MPRYLMSGSSMLCGKSSAGCTSSNINCSSAINFLDILSLKLLEMTKSLQEQFEECKHVPTTQASGFVLASVDVPKMVVGVKYEYIVYIQRYGPPTNGAFDESILTHLRTELGITSGL